ncbi:hypothetical protein SCOR_16800 [Sulfidibacter corallicola]
MSKKKNASGKTSRAKELRSLMGRRDWDGVNPVTRVIPNKKKEVSTRKAKHKGRGFDPFFVSAARGFGDDRGCRRSSPNPRGQIRAIHYWTSRLASS